MSLPGASTSSFAWHQVRMPGWSPSASRQPAPGAQFPDSRSDGLRLAHTRRIGGSASCADPSAWWQDESIIHGAKYGHAVSVLVVDPGHDIARAAVQAYGPESTRVHVKARPGQKRRLAFRVDAPDPTQPRLIGRPLTTASMQALLDRISFIA